MITEDYVSFETAKLLKEKGFNASEIDAYFPFVYYSDGKMDLYIDEKPFLMCGLWVMNGKILLEVFAVQNMAHK